MLTLSKATSLAKALVKWGSIIVGSIFLLIIFFRVGSALKQRIAPTPPPPPAVSFGKLPNIEFPENENQKQFSFELDTISGTLPSFSDRVKVYKMASNNPDLLALQKAQQKVASVGFTSQPTRLSENVYQWTDATSIVRKITLDIFSSDFTLSSTLASNEAITSGLNLPNQNNAVQVAQSFLLSMSSFPSDIDFAKTQTSLFSIKNYTLVPATSISSAQIIRVDFFQKNIDKMSIYYPRATLPNISVFVGGGEREPQVVKIDFINQSITNDSSTYPIKTANEAFSQLREGNAYIASYSNDGNQNISIKDVSLGYYIGEKKQDYLIPIFIFKGDHDFFAYVLAVKDEWINK